MHVEQPAPLPDQASPPPVRLVPVLRLVPALVLTLAILPYAWGRLTIFWMLVGAPERLYMAFFALSLTAIIVVTRDLSREFARPRLDRWLLWGVVGGWVVLN